MSSPDATPIQNFHESFRDLFTDSEHLAKYSGLVTKDSAKKVQTVVASRSEDASQLPVDGLISQADINKATRSTIRLSDLKKNADLIKEASALGKTFVFNVGVSKPRLLQTTQTTSSKMLNAMTPANLSALLIGVSILIPLLIAIKCMLDLKTNARFPRNNLAVGKES